MYRINDRDKQILEAVVNANDVTFTSLAKLADLDPKIDFRFADLREVDFRGSDLRGYDFTGSSLLGAIKDNTTKIDETTILEGAEIGWIEADSTDIVRQMQAIQGASSSNIRQKLLVELIENYRSADHIRQFLLTSIRRAQSIETFFDFSNAIQSDSDPHTDRVILEELSRLVEAKGRATDRTRKKVAQTPQGLDLILRCLEETLNPTLQRVGQVLFCSDEPIDRFRLLNAIGKSSGKLI